MNGCNKNEKNNNIFAIGNTNIMAIIREYNDDLNKVSNFKSTRLQFFKKQDAPTAGGQTEYRARATPTSNF